MKKLVIFLVWFGLALFLYEGAMADLFRWVDEKGVIHITDYPSPNQKNITALPAGKDDKKPEGIKQDPPEKTSVAVNTDKAVKEPKGPQVELYTTSWCPYCRQARNFFQSRRIPFTEFDVEKDKEAALRKRQLDPREGVPLAVINGQRIHGFSEAAYKKALEESL
jgi:glutaredoxin